MKLSRKDFLRLGLVGGAGLFLPFGASGCGLIAGNNSAEGSAGALLKSEVALPEPFTVPLPVPPVLEPARADAAADYYEITQRVGRAEILPGRMTEVWGYDGIFPGPTIRSRRGRQTVVRHRMDFSPDRRCTRGSPGSTSSRTTQKKRWGCRRASATFR